MIYILLPVHNRCEVTRRFIECLKVQTYQKFHLILIDDGSSDGTTEMVSENISSLTIIRGTGNWWWAGSLQQGYLWLKRQNIPVSDLVLIINDDTEFEANFFEIAIDLLYNRARTLLLAQSYSRQDGRLIDIGVHVDWRTLSHEKAITPGRINCLSTRGLFMQFAALKEIGGFYPQLLPHYLSDYEFTIRAHHKGMNLCTYPTLKLVVDEEITASRILNPRSLSILEMFSKRYIDNPFYWMVYVSLACPWNWKLINITRIIMRMSLDIFRRINDNCYR